MIENNFNKPVKNLDNNTSENKNEGAVERDWANLSSKDLMDLLEKLESFEDDEENLKQIPELIVEGKLEKDTFAALMIYKAPVYIIANKDSANKIINCLNILKKMLTIKTIYFNRYKRNIVFRNNIFLHSIMRSNIKKRTIRFVFFYFINNG